MTFTAVIARLRIEKHHREAFRPASADLHVIVVSIWHCACAAGWLCSNRSCERHAIITTCIFNTHNTHIHSDISRLRPIKDLLPDTISYGDINLTIVLAILLLLSCPQKTYPPKPVMTQSPPYALNPPAVLTHHLLPSAVQDLSPAPVMVPEGVVVAARVTGVAVIGRRKGQRGSSRHHLGLVLHNMTVMYVSSCLDEIVLNTSVLV